MIENLTYLRVSPMFELADDPGTLAFVKTKLNRRLARENSIIRIKFLFMPFPFELLEANPFKGRVGPKTKIDVEGLQPFLVIDPSLAKMHLYWTKKLTCY